MQIRRTLVALATALVCSAGAAPWSVAQTAGGSTIHSPACQKALAEVQAQEAIVLNARGVRAPASAPAGKTPDQLLAMRERAARICLGPGTSGPSPSQHTVQQPITVPSAAPPQSMMVPSAPAPTTTTPVAPQRNDPLLTIVGCDASSCWTSDGTRLQKSGPNLIGPRGVCTMQGPVLRCPP